MTILERNNKLKHFINCLKCEVSGKDCDVNCSTQYDAGNMGEIIENLEAISKALNQEPCEDCISRQALIEKATSWDKHFADSERCVSLTDIQGAPPVTPQPKRGKWIVSDTKEEGYDIGGYKSWYIQIRCSNCHFIKTAIEGHTAQYNFCPMCGARMDAEMSEVQE